MAKAARKVRLAASGEELGEQLLQAVREMKAGVRGRVHTPEVGGIAEARLSSGLSQASFAALMVDPAGLAVFCLLVGVPLSLLLSALLLRAYRRAILRSMDLSVGGGVPPDATQENPSRAYAAGTLRVELVRGAEGDASPEPATVVLARRRRRRLVQAVLVAERRTARSAMREIAGRPSEEGQL